MRRLRSQIDRQMASKFCRQADACQEIWPLYDGKYASKMRADHFGIGSKYRVRAFWQWSAGLNQLDARQAGVGPGFAKH